MPLSHPTPRPHRPRPPGTPHHPPAYQRPPTPRTRPPPRASLPRRHAPPTPPPARPAPPCPASAGRLRLPQRPTWCPHRPAPPVRVRRSRLLPSLRVTPPRCLRPPCRVPPCPASAGRLRLPHRPTRRPHRPAPPARVRRSRLLPSLGVTPPRCLRPPYRVPPCPAWAGRLRLPQRPTWCPHRPAPPVRAPRSRLLPSVRVTLARCLRPPQATRRGLTLSPGRPTARLSRPPAPRAWVLRMPTSACHPRRPRPHRRARCAPLVTCRGVLELRPPPVARRVSGVGRTAAGPAAGATPRRPRSPRGCGPCPARRGRCRRRSRRRPWLRP